MVDGVEEKLGILTQWAKAVHTRTIEKQGEQQLKPRFLIDIFEKCLGYEHSPSAEERNLHIEEKSETDSTTPDAVLGFLTDDSKLVQVVVEIKDARTDLDKPQHRYNDKRSPVEQAFSYVSKSGGNCKWVIVSNFKEIRLYHASDQSRYELIPVVELEGSVSAQQRFFYLLSCDRLLKRSGVSFTERVYTERIAEEQKISKEFYKEYKGIRSELFGHLVSENVGYSQDILFGKAQKILDRLIFIRFCECLNLIPNATLAAALKAAEATFARTETKLWEQVVGLCEAIDKGWPDKNINRFNGGLFAHDEVLDGNLVIKDMMVKRLAFLNNYDFESDLNVNILGHIFEQSISDIEETKAQLSGAEFDEKKGKRKKDGIFYTPEYITRYIVKQAVGGWLEDRKIELGFESLPELTEADYDEVKKSLGKGKKATLPKKIQKHLEFWNAYEEKLRNIKVLDPACGSGAFLVQVFDYLFREGQYVNQIKERLTGKPLLFDLQKHILTENIFGVDLNEESVEITKLSLWLKTANKSKELTTLDNNIQCGNSLIDDPAIAGDKAFNWSTRFGSTVPGGTFDVVIGNPPWGAFMSEREWLKIKYAKTSFGNIDSYKYFVEQGFNLLQYGGRFGFIIPDSYLEKEYFIDLRTLVVEGSDSIANYKLGDDVFEGVNLPSALLFFRKIISIEKQFEFKDISSSINKKDVIYNSDDVVTLTPEYQKAFKPSRKILRDNDCAPLIELYDQVMGVKVYQIGKGKPKQTNIQFDNNIFISKTALGSDYYRFISEGIKRYYYEGNEEFIRYGEWLAEPRSINYFNQPKIVVREIVNPRIYATLIDYPSIVKNTAAVIIPRTDKYSLKYLICLLNSKLFTYEIVNASAKSANKTYPSFTSKVVKGLPIKLLSDERQKNFIQIADKILVAFDLIRTVRMSFQKLIFSEFGISKPSTKLQNWDLLSWEEFDGELKKQKVKMTLSQKNEWMTHFETEKAKATILRKEIEDTDIEIDKMVYKLYDLTEEEIGIVEGSSSLKLKA